MSKAAHNIPPKRLSVEIRKTIALDAVANTISSAARQHQVTNKTAARHRNKALEAINQTFDKHGMVQKPAILVPNHNTYFYHLVA